MKCFVFCLFFKLAFSLWEGDDCVMIDPTLGSGKCISVFNCDHARKLIKQRSTPQHCGFNKKTPLVCCPQHSLNKLSQNEKLSTKKCKKYFNDRTELVIVAGGVKASASEFSHMAAIGYGTRNISWLCGGSLISEQFVLTAAHCGHSREFGKPQVVRLGELDFNNTSNLSVPQDFEIDEIYIHPSYKSSSHYNDIALLKLKTVVTFHENIKPACLHTAREIPNRKMEVIGWGTTYYFGPGSSHLMKASLDITSNQNCSQSYRGLISRKLSRGIEDDTQVCAGDSLGKDTCPGDSGGPLHFKQVASQGVLSHFVVVGITSFGRGCGGGNTFGVYTRVSAYISWIENIVWAPIQ